VIAAERRNTDGAPGCGVFLCANFTDRAFHEIQPK
jgi:hypothetical protein